MYSIHRVLGDIAYGDIDVTFDHTILLDEVQKNNYHIDQVTQYIQAKFQDAGEYLGVDSILADAAVVDFNQIKIPTC